MILLLGLKKIPGAPLIIIIIELVYKNKVNCLKQQHSCTI